MSNNTKRYIACLLFSLAAFGAFLPSWIHVAAYFAGAVPPAWLYAAYIGAFALDSLAVACGYGLILTADDADGRRWLNVGLWAPVILSVWVNWRYVAAHPVAGAYALDPFVSACLPVLLVIATHGLAAVLRAIPADAPAVDIPGGSTITVGVTPYVDAPVHINGIGTVTASPGAPPYVPPKPARKATAPRPAGQPREWEAPALALLRDGLAGAEIARRVGVDPAQVSRLKARMGGQAVAQ